MAVAYGARINDDTNFITEIDLENKTCETTGYIAGEAADFSGGGSGELSTAVLRAEDMDGVDLIEDSVVPLFQGPFVATLPPALDGIECSNFNDMLSDGTLILYKGCAMIAKTAAAEWPVSSISENIEDIGDGAYLVTGDCTIVFNTN